MKKILKNFQFFMEILKKKKFSVGYENKLFGTCKRE